MWKRSIFMPLPPLPLPLPLPLPFCSSNISSYPTHQNGSGQSLPHPLYRFKTIRKIFTDTNTKRDIELSVTIRMGLNSSITQKTDLIRPIWWNLGAWWASCRTSGSHRHHTRRRRRRCSSCSSVTSGRNGARRQRPIHPQRLRPTGRRRLDEKTSGVRGRRNHQA